MGLDKKSIKEIWFALQFGFQVIGAFVIAVCIGLWLDGMFSSSPLAILVMILLAFVYVIWLLLSMLKK